MQKTEKNIRKNKNNMREKEIINYMWFDKILLTSSANSIHEFLGDIF